MFAIRGIDHIVLAVADVERSLAFYHGILGLPVEREAEWRAGRVGFPSVRVDDHFIIDLFQRPADAPAPGPGQHNLNHFCLVTDEADLAAVRRDLEARGVAVLRGPVARWGAQGEALSVYLHDPDGNEVEIRSYAPAARQEAERLRAAAR
jgi:catechol 2,3-dioxygenase-like lactoylglutathione lyase family enzyme